MHALLVYLLLTATTSFQPDSCTCPTQSSDTVSAATFAVTQDAGTAVTQKHCGNSSNYTQTKNPSSTEVQSIDGRTPSSSTENRDGSKETTGGATVNANSTRVSTLIITENLSNTETLICPNGTAKSRHFNTFKYESEIICSLAAVSAILLVVCIILTILVVRLRCSKKENGRWN